MEQPQGLVTGPLKKILFRQATKSARLQPLWSRLHTLSKFAMNYGGGGLIETSGEAWVVSRVVRPACERRARAVVFDVGANTGDYSLLVARHLPEARIYAFEPSKTVYEQLGRSLADGRTSAPSTSASPAPAERRRCTHTRWKGNASRCSRPSTAGCRRRCLRVELAATEPIDVQTLDAFCEEQGVGHIDLLKLDVEGHELAVLRGAERMLSAGRVSMIQFEFGPANIYSRTYFYDFWAMLAPAYDLFRIVPRGIVAIPGYGEHLEVFLTTNYLAVRRGD